jgi:hypothetical protein
MNHLDQRGVDQLHLVRWDAFYEKANRQTMAICHGHNLSSFTALRLPDFGPPFLPGRNCHR